MTNTAHPGLFAPVLSLVDVNNLNGNLRIFNFLLMTKNHFYEEFFAAISSYQFLVTLVKVGKLGGGNPGLHVLALHLNLNLNGGYLIEGLMT